MLGERKEQPSELKGLSEKMTENLGPQSNESVTNFFGSLESKMREFAKGKGLDQDRIREMKEKMNSVMEDLWPE